MKTIGFIGGFAKTDLILYTAKMLREAGQKIIFVDATICQRARYIVPTINQGVRYVTEFEGYDLAIGFRNFEEIKKFIQVTEKRDFEYDLVLIDVDSKKAFEEFNLINADKRYFVTAFDNYSLRKGLAVFSKLPSKIEVTKVLFSRDMLKEEDIYLNYISSKFGIQWNKTKIYFPHEQGDCSVIIDNQRAEKIRFKNLSMTYKEGLLELSSNILPEISASNFKKTLKNL